MSTRAFNHYVEMYYSEHSDLPENISALIDKSYAATDTTPRLHINSMSKSPYNIDLIRHPIAANARSKQHSHDYFELIYVSKGSCTQKIGDLSANLHAGDFCLLNPYVTHEIDIDTPDTFLFNIIIKQNLFRESFLCMLTGNDLISNFFVSSLFTESQQKSFLLFCSAENATAVNLIETLIIELLEKKMGYQKAAENYLALFFLELARSRQNRLDQENFGLMGNNQLSEILAYINQHKQDVTLSSVAKHFHYHPKYLSALIKKHTNKSFSDILQEARLQETCNYLKNTTYSIDEITHLTGYYDRSYFNRMFKKNFGMTPGEYRKQMESDKNRE